MKELLLIGVCWGCAQVIHAQNGPGGVTANLRLWLKADQGTSTAVNGATVNAWSDASVSPNNPTITGAPTYISGSAAFNYNPAIQFSGSAYLSNMALCTGVGNADLFYVLRCASATSSSPLQELHSFDGVGGLGSAFPAADGKLYDDFGASGLPGPSLFLKSFTPANDITVPFIYNSSNAGTALAHTSSAYVNGRVMYSNNEGMTLPVYPLTSYFFKGDYSAATTAPLANTCAEIILYTSDLNAANRQAVLSYLALKYGIPLDQTVSCNYTASDGTVTWNATANAAYKNNISGIGRDDASGFLQKQSSSVNAGNSGNLLSISLGPLATSNQANPSSLVSDKSYFINGDNLMALTGGSMTTHPAGIYTRLQRSWKCQATNFTQALSVGFESSLLAAYDPISNLRLLTDDDGDFSNATIETVPALMNGTHIEFQNISGLGTAGKRFFTLASADMSTPLPLTLLYFTSACAGNRVQLEWSTAGGSSCDHFVVERSVDGVNYTALKTVKADPNPAEGHTYRIDDESLAAERWYYRLRQSDASGNSVVSAVISTEQCRKQEKEILFYPNPLAGQELLSWELELSITQSIRLHLFNSYGHICLEQTIDPSADGYKGALSLAGLGPGLYFIQVDGQPVYRLMKQ